jgi:hypothetical protein
MPFRISASENDKKAATPKRRGQLGAADFRGDVAWLRLQFFREIFAGAGAARSYGARAGKIFNCHRTVGRSPSQVRPFFKATLVNKSAAQPLQAARRIPNMERSTI